MTKFKPKGWDELFIKNSNRWNTPNEFVHLLIDGLHKQFTGNISVLDAGFGAGRHIVHLQNQGFSVSGFDIAKNAKQIVSNRLIEQRIHTKIDLKIFDMHIIPWPYNSNFFQGILSINVIHHTNYDGFLQTIKEITRILVSGGLFLGTIASKDNHKFGLGTKIDDHTFLTNSGSEKGIPHTFFDENELKEIFKNDFEIIVLQKISGEIPKADMHLKKENALDHWLIFIQKK